MKTTEKKILKQHKNQTINLNKLANPTKKDWWVLLIISLFALAIYANTIPFKYTFDDIIVISENKFTTNGVEGIKDILSNDSFTGYYGKNSNIVAGGRYRPLSLISFALERQFFGENPHISHLINILLYAITAWLVFLITSYFLKCFDKSTWFKSMPFYCALLFVAHPIHTEVVANIKGRDEIMSLLFSLITLWISIKYVNTGKIKYIVQSGLVFFLALLSKENSITFVAIIPLSIYYFTPASWKMNLNALWPLLIASFLFLIIRQNMIGVSNNELTNDLMNNPYVGMTIVEKYSTIMYTLGIYIKLLFFPHPLTFDYYPYHIPIVNWFQLEAIVPLIFYIGAVVWIILHFKEKSPVVYAMIFFLAGISIVSNLFFPVGVFMNERFVYLPSVAFCMLIAFWLFIKLPAALKMDTTKYSIPFLILVLVLFSYKTISRNKVWESNFVLFTTDVETSFNSAKSNADTGEYLMKSAILSKDSKVKAEQFEKAIIYLNRAIDIYPKNAPALFNLINVYYRYNKNFDGILDVAKKVLKISPYEVKIFHNIPLMLKDLQDSDYKIKFYKELEKLSPNNSEIYLYLGREYLLGKNDVSLALPYLERSVEIKPDLALAQNSLGVAYYMVGNLRNALISFETAISITPNDKEVLTNLIATNRALGNIAKAENYTALLKQQNLNK